MAPSLRQRQGLMDPSQRSMNQHARVRQGDAGVDQEAFAVLNRHAGLAASGRNVLLVSYHLYPDAEVGARRPSELMLYLSRNGYKVDALAARLRRSDRTDADLGSRLEELRVMRVSQPPDLISWLWKHLKPLASKVLRGLQSGGDRPSRHSSAVSRNETASGKSPASRIRRQYFAALAFLDSRKGWAILSMLRLCFNWSRRYQVVISSGPPSATHVVGCFAAWLHRAGFVMDFRDPWVSHSYLTRDDSHPFLGGLERWAERACIRRARAVAVTTPGIGRLLVTRYPEYAHKIKVIYNGYDGELADSSSQPPGRFDMLYAGTLYLNRDPFPILEAFKLMLSMPGVQRVRTSLTFVGQCDTWNGRSLLEWVEHNSMSDVVRVLPPVSRREIEELTARSSVLVNLAQGQPDQIPAKTFEYLASGKLMLLVSEESSSTAELVRGVSSVELVRPDDPVPKIVEVLARLYTATTIGDARLRTDPAQIARFARDKQNRQFMSILGMSNPGEKCGTRPELT